ncbi:class I SAM-dependent methyltransferase [Geotalea uraniireducens]|uniref:Methyltransferase type 11 n=1 Tax=Geotalea uraniireducens (strain Rf4) TaxID=351605 RepID=A5G4Q1_GEOUR|nr:class I SAM-dependent methyltransferase [Geotalea uraniireducens]ABQ26769.1 Methyltransferase type 11 [Geotalea uraniireducens Rf4]
MNRSRKPETYFTHDRQEMLDFIPADAQRVLDVGCGEGTFGCQVKQSRNAEVWGAELDNAAAHIAGQRLDKVLSGDFGQLISELPDGYFDCMIFNDVLEHFVDPFTILFDVKTKLSEHGVVVCSIPNIRYFYTLKRFLFQGEWKYEDAGILDRTHLRFFTQNSLIDMFESLEYDLICIKGINPALSWKFKLLNAATFGFLSDTQYYQFACVAMPRTKGRP